MIDSRTNKFTTKKYIKLRVDVTKELYVKRPMYAVFWRVGIHMTFYDDGH